MLSLIGRNSAVGLSSICEISLDSTVGLSAVSGIAGQSLIGWHSVIGFSAICDIDLDSTVGLSAVSGIAGRSLIGRNSGVCLGCIGCSGSVCRIRLGTIYCCVRSNCCIGRVRLAA